MTAIIAGVDAWEVLDSRGRPTVACEVRLDGGARGTASVPSGASTGRHEVCELRDGGDRYGGQGVRHAVRNVVDVLGPCVLGMDAGEQGAVDAALRSADGTPALSRLGGNAVLAVSIATALAAASAHGLPLYRWLARETAPLLPMPMVNILSGGAHAGGAVDVQDFLVVPVGASSFAEAIEWAARVRAATASVAAERGLDAGPVADEGGMGLHLASNRDALELLAAGMDRSGLRPGEDVAIAIDVAATQLARGDGYRLAREDRSLTSQELVDELVTWAEAHPVLSIEDPLAEDDWEGWSIATQRFAGSIQLLGDDLFVTNADRLARGIADGVANAVLVKVNQNGTVSGAADIVSQARTAGFATVVSARSGETEDAWLADLAIGWRAGQIKVGSTMRSERGAKWNRLLRIEHELGAQAEFAGRRPFRDRRTIR